MKSYHDPHSRAGLLKRFRDYVNSRGLYNRWGYSALDYRCRQLFCFSNGITGKNVLEIGGGEGLFSLWAFVHGAYRVIMLEPEGEGSASGSVEKFLQHRRALGIGGERLRLVSKRFQNYDGEGKPFDLILSFNSINHLEESLAASLDVSIQAQRIYVDLFKKAYGLLHAGGSFIISDSGRTNYWNRLGLTSPFAPNIEWHKHQDPDLWQSLLKEAGFQCHSMIWHSFYPLRFFRRLLTNSFIAKWMTSQFVISAQKV